MKRPGLIFLTDENQAHVEQKAREKLEEHERAQSDRVKADKGID